MNKQTFLLSAVIVASSLPAAAQQTPPPTISQTPMAQEPALSGNASDPPSDLPAPETHSWVNKPLLITSSSLLVAAYVPALVISTNQ